MQLTKEIPCQEGTDPSAGLLAITTMSSLRSGLQSVANLPTQHDGTTVNFDVNTVVTLAGATCQHSIIPHIFVWGSCF